MLAVEEPAKLTLRSLKQRVRRDDVLSGVLVVSRSASRLRAFGGRAGCSVRHRVIASEGGPVVRGHRGRSAFANQTWARTSLALLHASATGGPWDIRLLPAVPTACRHMNWGRSPAYSSGVEVVAEVVQAEKQAPGSEGDNLNVRRQLFLWSSLTHFCIGECTFASARSTSPELSKNEELLLPLSATIVSQAERIQRRISCGH